MNQKIDTDQAAPPGFKPLQVYLSDEQYDEYMNTPALSAEEWAAVEAEEAAKLEARVAAVTYKRKPKK